MAYVRFVTDADTASPRGRRSSQRRQEGRVPFLQEGLTQNELHADSFLQKAPFGDALAAAGTKGRPHCGALSAHGCRVKRV